MGHYHPFEQRKTSCLRYLGNDTTQLYGDFFQPLQGPLLNNQHNGK